MVPSEHRRPLMAFLFVSLAAALILGNGLRARVVGVLIAQHAPGPVISALAPDLVVGHRLLATQQPPLSAAAVDSTPRSSAHRPSAQSPAQSPAESPAQSSAPAQPVTHREHRAAPSDGRTGAAPVSGSAGHGQGAQPHHAGNGPAGHARNAGHAGSGSHRVPQPSGHAHGHGGPPPGHAHNHGNGHGHHRRTGRVTSATGGAPLSPSLSGGNGHSNGHAGGHGGAHLSRAHGPGRGHGPGHGHGSGHGHAPGHGHGHGKGRGHH